MMMTIEDYINQVATMNDVIVLAQQLKKQKMNNYRVNGFVSLALIKLNEVNPDDHARYVEYVGCHKGIKEGYDCIEYKINCNHGGTIKVCDWIGVENTNSLATIHTSNGWGLGSSEYINNLEDVDEHISNADKITWIDDEEREFLVSALQNLKRTNGA